MIRYRDASAIVAGRQRPSAIAFVWRDRRLASAAEVEGVRLAPRE
ncbi:MAG: hypothetical protein M5U08_00850 [Burkholderiales bacterium]|nr:hypothetical protein [Burkholderiales bacterium]